MDYNLANKLMDAGFPQKHANDVGWRDIPSDFVPTYFPTLEELIESVGFENFSLQETEGNWLCRGGGSKYTAVVGTSPIEAVANLWLSLNEKV